MKIIRQKRLATIFFSSVLLFILLLAGLWKVQIRDGDKYTVMALEQGSSYVSLEEFSRGKLLDRNKVSLTGDYSAERVVVFPSLVDKEVVIGELAEVLTVSENELAGMLQDTPCYFPYALSAEQAEEIKRRDWPGVDVMPVSFRYGEKPLAVQVTGHLGKISSPEEWSRLSSMSDKSYHYGDLVGKIGLEKIYEQELKGERPLEAVRVYYDALGNVLQGSVLTADSAVRDNNRRDLVLTIDARIQGAVESILERHSVKGAVVVMEAGTGDLLALAGAPSFHPGRIEEYLQSGQDEQFFDRCTALYQPGSIFKIAVAAAALESDMDKHGGVYTCNGADDSLIHCWQVAGHGSLSFSRAFAESCNPAFAQIGLNLGASKIIEYAERLGLDNQSVIGYELTRDSRQNMGLIGEPYNLVNSSIGQGPVLVTPVQVSAMLNTIISGGIYREPRLVKALQRQDGETDKEFMSDPGRRAIEMDTAAALRELLDLAADEGLAMESLVPVYLSSGKTGSAQTGNREHAVNAWFTGYAPRDNPRYVVTVLVLDGVSGSVSAVPLFLDIMEQLLAFN